MIFVLHISMLLALSTITVIILTRLKSEKRETFVLFLFCVILYVLGSMQVIGAQTAETVLMGLGLVSLGGLFIAPTYLLFTQRYCERYLPRFVNYLVFITAAIGVIIVCTSRWHSLFAAHVFLCPDGGNGVSTWLMESGVLYFPVAVVHPTLTAFLSYKILGWKMRRVDAAHRKKLWILLACAVVPAVAQLTGYFWAGVYGFFISVFIIPIVCALGYFGIHQYDLLENEESIRARNHLRDMVRNISHDIKTPLTALSVNLENFLHTSQADAGQMREIQVAYKKSLDLQRLILNLIEATRIESAQSAYQLEWASLNGILANVQERYIDDMESAGLMLDVVSSGEDVQIFVDPSKIWSVFDNVIYNALRHTKKGGITITAMHLDETHMSIVIADTGVGITPERLTHIFKRYHQRGKKDNIGESGLGLFIVKSVMEAMDGKIEIKSEVGVGTIVELQFNKKDQDAA